MKQTLENDRCPVCGEQGFRIQYGMPACPPEPGVILGGCIVSPDNPDSTHSTGGFFADRFQWRLTILWP